MKGGCKAMCMHLIAVMNTEPPVVSDALSKHAANSSHAKKEMYFTVAYGEADMKKKGWAYAVAPAEQRAVAAARQQGWPGGAVSLLRWLLPHSQ
jgi:hypothetical protein